MNYPRPQTTPVTITAIGQPEEAGQNQYTQKDQLRAQITFTDQTNVQRFATCYYDKDRPCPFNEQDYNKQTDVILKQSKNSNFWYIRKPSTGSPLAPRVSKLEDEVKVLRKMILKMNKNAEEGKIICDGLSMEIYALSPQEPTPPSPDTPPVSAYE